MFNDTQGKRYKIKWKAIAEIGKHHKKKTAIILYSNKMGYKIQLRLFFTMILIWPATEQ
jgi:hypothetical protein